MKEELLRRKEEKVIIPGVIAGYTGYDRMVNPGNLFERSYGRCRSRAKAIIERNSNVNKLKNEIKNKLSVNKRVDNGNKIGNSFIKKIKFHRKNIDEFENITKSEKNNLKNKRRAGKITSNLSNYLKGRKPKPKNIQTQKKLDVNTSNKSHEIPKKAKSKNRFTPIVGYQGFVPRIASDNIHGIRYASNFSAKDKSIKDLERWKKREKEIRSESAGKFVKKKREVNVEERKKSYDYFTRVYERNNTMGNYRR